MTSPIVRYRVRLEDGPDLQVEQRPDRPVEERLLFPAVFHVRRSVALAVVGVQSFGRRA